MKPTQRWQDWLNLIFGAWLFIAPVAGVGAGNDIAAWNAYIFGAAIVFFSVAALIRPQLWEEWVNLYVGVWLIFAPFVLGFVDQTAVMWNHIVVGLAVGGDALWAMLSPRIGRPA